MQKYIIPFMLMLVTSANAQNFQVKDTNVYTKLKTNFNGATQEETGLTARLWKQDRWSLSGNVGFLENYPLNGLQHRSPGYTAGATLKYRLVNNTFQLSAYTKVKYDCVSTFAQESGLTATLWKNGDLSVIGNVGWVNNYPFKDDTNSWTSGIQLNFKLK